MTRLMPQRRPAVDVQPLRHAFEARFLIVRAQCSRDDAVDVTLGHRFEDVDISWCGPIDKDFQPRYPLPSGLGVSTRWVLGSWNMGESSPVMRTVTRQSMSQPLHMAHHHAAAESFPRRRARPHACRHHALHLDEDVCMRGFLQDRPLFTISAQGEPSWLTRRLIKCRRDENNEVRPCNQADEDTTTESQHLAQTVACFRWNTQGNLLSEEQPLLD